MTATTTGTILTKPVSIGQVIQAGGTSVSGGTVIATMADLTKVRARALVAETDIGMVKPGQTVNVAIDAFPDHPFVGKVDHIEPQATVQQNVTMFATLVALDNSDGLLQPGMNGEVSIIADTRLDALAVPNDAIRSPREATQAAALLGLNPDSVRAQMQARRRWWRWRRPGWQRGRSGRPAAAAAAPAADARCRSATVSSRSRCRAADRAAGVRGGQRGPQVQVTDADCKKVDDAMKKKPAVAKKIDDMRTKMRDPNADRQKMKEDMKALVHAARRGHAGLRRVPSQGRRRQRGRIGAGARGGGQGAAAARRRARAAAAAGGRRQRRLRPAGQQPHASAHRPGVRAAGHHVGRQDHPPRRRQLRLHRSRSTTG